MKAALSTSVMPMLAPLSVTVWPSLTVRLKPVSTGASLTALTVRLAVSVATENAVMPPLAVVSALSPLLPLVRSQARKVIALLCVPL